jgi:hypothetical protein
MFARRSAVIAGVIGVVAAATFSGDQPRKTTIEERRLIVIRGGSTDEIIRVRVGDVVQFQPFSLPVIPAFLEAQLRIELDGQAVLEEIGQLTAPSAKEGRSALCAFLLAREPGHTTVTLSVLSEGQQIADKYRASYTLECAQE